MTKTEFFNIIRNGLKDLPENEVNDILYDYEEHFASASSDGKTEQEILDELGDPYYIIEQYKNTNSSKVKPKTSKNTNTIDSSLIILIIIAVVCFPAITGVGGMLIGLIAVLCFVPFGLTMAGVGSLLADFGVSVLGISSIPNFITDLPISALILFTIGSLLCTILGVILSVYIVKAFVLLVKKIVELFKGKSKKEDVTI